MKVLTLIKKIETLAPLLPDSVTEACGWQVATAIDRWVLDHTELQALFLMEKEWATLEKLGDILQSTPAGVTLQMSQSKTPTLPWVLPMYELMVNHLTKTSENTGIPSALRLAAAAGLGKLY
ncbi:hypothetical protein K438DRAFT_1758728 [Mycena galopus ATCC 62051]|nr:hypothetical protein K438DRAFT_1758728 [Mycena galopus ATCC 62051]